MHLPIGGLVPLTTVDWPGQLSAVVFLRGCPWRCTYCHNTKLQSQGESLRWEGILKFLRDRKGLLDGLVFSGGEPTLHKDLLEATRQVKELGFGVALHTGGAFPKRLGELLKSGNIDWVGFDVKGPLCRYSEVTGSIQAGDQAAESLRILLASGVPYELRSTIAPSLTSQDVVRMAQEIVESGGKNLILQRCVSKDSARVNLNSMADSIRNTLTSVRIREAFVG